MVPFKRILIKPLKGTPEALKNCSQGRPRSTLQDQAASPKTVWEKEEQATQEHWAVQ